MNNARTNGSLLQRVWLKVNKVSKSNEKNVILRGEMFDGTPFDISVPEHEFENQGPDVPSLIEVGLVGNIGSTVCEVVLPYPALNYGYNVRVSSSSLIKWDSYLLIKEKNDNAKKFI